MAKPRIFVSSTYYDLRHIRKSLEDFIEGFGYEPVLFESGDIPFSHEQPLDVSCYEEIKLCHMLVLIIGSRYGSPASAEEENLSDEDKDKRYAFYNSITSIEYEKAVELDIPIYIFVQKDVAAEYETWKKNRESEIDWAHVDNPSIFNLLFEIFRKKRNNLVHHFENFGDISSWLTEQWSGLFAALLSKRTEDSRSGDLSTQISEMDAAVGTLRSLVEHIVKSSDGDGEGVIDRARKEQEERELQIRFESNDFVEHMVSNHEVDPEELKRVFKSANNLKDFERKLKQMNAKNKDCMYFRVQEMFPIHGNSINRVRTLLGGEAFPLRFTATLKPAVDNDRSSGKS